MFESVINAGFDYIDLPLSLIASLPADKRRFLDKKLSEHSLVCESAYLLFPHSLPLTGDDFSLEAVKSHAEKVLAVAEDTGTRTVVFGNGGSRRVSRGKSRSAVACDILSILREIEPIAEKRGVRIALEPLCARETDMINTFAEAALFGELSGEYIGAVSDLYHTVTDGRAPDEARIDPAKLFHLHVARPSGRLIPSPDDDRAIYESFFAMAKDVGYTGGMSIEAGMPAGGDADAVLSSSLTYLRSF